MQGNHTVRNYVGTIKKKFRKIEDVLDQFVLAYDASNPIDGDKHLKMHGYRVSFEHGSKSMRNLIVTELASEGHNQELTALILGINQSTVTRYLNMKEGK